MPLFESMRFISGSKCTSTCRPGPARSYRVATEGKEKRRTSSIAGRYFAEIWYIPRDSERTVLVLLLYIHYFCVQPNFIADGLSREYAVPSARIRPRVRRDHRLWGTVRVAADGWGEGQSLARRIF